MQGFRRGLEMGPLGHDPDKFGGVLESQTPEEFCK